MASLAKDRGKRGITRRVLFKAADGQRKAIHLGDVTAKQATTILAHVDHLERSLFDGSAPPTQTAAWLAEIGDTLRAKLDAHGLTAPKVEAQALTLGALLDKFKARPRWLSHKPATRRNQDKAFRYLLAHFGNDKSVKGLSEADAEDYRAKLELPKGQGGKGLAKSTANRACAMAWALFRYAIRSRLSDRNPFDEVSRGHASRGDNVLVSAADTRKVMAELSNTFFFFADPKFMGKFYELESASWPRTIKPACYRNKHPHWYLRRVSASCLAILDFVASIAGRSKA